MLIEKLLNGDIRSIAQAISLVENDHEDVENLIDQIYPYCGQAIIWGVTGPSGSGKSSLVDHLISIARRKNRKVAVLAIDPSSAFSGGAILGDRVRMQRHATDDGVFIRSMASRGHLGGVSKATADAIKVLDAAGFNPILIETIGVGQNEIQIMELSDIVLLVLVPGLGDEIQALKAGIMEIGDIFIINKSDRDDADKMKAEIEYALSFKQLKNTYIQNPVLKTSARLNEGIEELVITIESYLKILIENGQFESKRRKRFGNEIRNILSQRIELDLHKFINHEGKLDQWIDSVKDRKNSPYELVNEKFATFLKEYKNS